MAPVLIRNGELRLMLIIMDIKIIIIGGFNTYSVKIVAIIVISTILN